jgi:hypothetical protein
MYLEKLDWNYDIGGNRQNDDDEEFIGSEGEEEIGISHYHEKPRAI